MPHQALIKLAPSFKHDGLEPWEVYLPRQDMKARMQAMRSEYVKMHDTWSTFRTNFLQNSNVDPRESQEYQSKLKDFKRRRAAKADKILKVVESYKKEAEARKASELVAMAKRPRLEEVDPDDISDLEGDIEFEDNDYMPSCTLPYQTSSNEPAQSTTSVPEPEAPTINPLTDVPYFEESTFLKGVKEQDAEILQALKPLIMKYNCRDRVLRALRSYRARNKIALSLTRFDELVAKLKQQRKRL